MPNSPKKILIVEDNPSIMKAAVFALKEAGFEIDFAENGKDGLQKIREDNYDLVVLDLVMPGITGFEVMQQLKTLGNKMPIIVYSNMPEEDTQAEAMKMGAKDYFTKTTMSLQ